MRFFSLTRRLTRTQLSHGSVTDSNGKHKDEFSVIYNSMNTRDVSRKASVLWSYPCIWTDESMYRTQKC